MGLRSNGSPFCAPWAPSLRFFVLPLRDDAIKNEHTKGAERYGQDKPELSGLGLVARAFFAFGSDCSSTGSGALFCIIVGGGGPAMGMAANIWCV